MAWTPAAALCLVVAGAGAPRLARLTASSPAARAATAFAGVALLAALLADDRRTAFFGHYIWGTGWLFVLALVGAWAIGRSASGPGVRLIERALLAAGLVNAGFAVLEMSVDLTAFELGRFGGRAPGLVGNPVHLGGFAAATLALVVPRFVADRRWSVAVVVVAGAAQLSGARAGLALTILVTAVCAWRHRRSPRVAGLLVALVLAGLAGGSLLAQLEGGVSVTTRVQGAAVGGGFRPRIETWRAAVSAVADRPLVGIGPGRFRDAVAPARTVALARSEGPEKLFVDAHDLVVEYATTTGVLGLAALVTFGALAVREGRGPLLGFAVVLLANHVLAPQAVRTTPVALLALGAAAPVDGLRVLARRRAELVPVAAGAVVGLGAAATLLIGDFHLNQGRLDFSRHHARRALELLPSWPEPALLEGRIDLYDSRIRRRPELVDRSIGWVRTAVRRDPGNPQAWNTLGEYLLAAGRVDEAVDAFEGALRANPTSIRALNGLGRTARAAGDVPSARRWFERSLAVIPTQKLARQELAALSP